MLLLHVDNRMWLCNLTWITRRIGSSFRSLGFLRVGKSNTRFLAMHVTVTCPLAGRSLCPLDPKRKKKERALQKGAWLRLWFPPTLCEILDQKGMYPGQQGTGEYCIRAKRNRKIKDIHVYVSLGRCYVLFPPFVILFLQPFYANMLTERVVYSFAEIHFLIWVAYPPFNKNTL
jgi:hypothetical protein